MQQYNNGNLLVPPTSDAALATLPRLEVSAVGVCWLCGVGGLGATGIVGRMSDRRLATGVEGWYTRVTEGGVGMGLAEGDGSGTRTPRCLPVR
jgi:hypothetical protein